MAKVKYWLIKPEHHYTDLPAIQEGKRLLLNNHKMNRK
jgi:hypothetical protein